MSLENFHEVRLPLSVGFGAQGGPERRTDIVSLASGGETRNAVWAGSRRRWDLASAITKLDGLSRLVAFFEARRGRLHGFRFRDVVDDHSGPVGTDISATDVQIGIGDGQRDMFELTKTYGETTRRIWKPVEGSVRVALDGVETAAGIIVSNTRGEVRFTTPPIEGSTITAGFLFDVPVRFDTDRLETTLDAFEAGHVAQVPIVELLG